MASQLPILSLYVEHLGGNNAQVGLVMGSFAIGLLLARPRLGLMSDRQGRKIVLIIGAVVATIAPLGYIFAQSIPALIALRAFHGLSIAAFTTGYSALVVDLSPPENRGELIGYMTLTQPIGVALGPAIGSFLQVNQGYGWAFGVASLFGILACFGLLSVREARRPPLQVTVPPGDRPPSSATSATAPQRPPTVWQRLCSPQLRVPSTVMAVVGIVFGTLVAFIPLHIAAAGVDLIPGLFYTTAAIASFSARFGFGSQSDRYGRGLFITGALGCYVVAMTLLAIADQVSLFLFAALAEGTAAGLLIPMMVALVSDRAQPEERGQMFALCLLGFDLGLALAGPVLGSVSDRWGYRMIFAIAAILAAIALLIFTTLSTPTVRSSLRFALGRGRDPYAIAPTPPEPG
jgi:MFS family permease